MGLFSAIKSGLAKTRDALMGELKGIVGAGKITDDTLEELEEHLIKADVGVEAAFLLTDALREQALGKSLTTEQVLAIPRVEDIARVGGVATIDFHGPGHRRDCTQHEQCHE